MTFAPRICAVAALLAALFAGLSHAQGTAVSPFGLRCRTVDGRSVAGTVSSWDRDGCDGTFGRLAWADLPAAEVNRTIRRVIDDQNAEQLVTLGRALLCTEDGQNMGDSVLRQAVKRDGRVAPAADVARAEAVEARRVAAERRLRAMLPQAVEGSGVPSWPIASDADRAKALDEAKAEAERALDKVHLRWRPYESEFWVIYANLSRGDAQELGRRMDNMYRKVAEMFALPKGLNLFEGKGVCIVSPDETVFRAIEQAAFGGAPPEGCIGLCHMQGPKVIVNAWQSPHDDQFMATLVHEATHGIMYRYGSPQRLPIWAEEGYAEFVAARSFDSSPVDAGIAPGAGRPGTLGRRPQGLDFIRGGNATLPYFRTSGTDGIWPGPDAVGYSIGYLTVCLMIDQKGSAFGEWVKDVKRGIPWEQALKSRFGTDAVQLAQTIEGFYREHMSSAEAR